MFSKVLQTNSLFKSHHTFSAGFSSGLYGGKKIRTILRGISNDFDLWNDPLSKTTTFNSEGFILENSSRKI
jgi:hypothetical protein